MKIIDIIFAAVSGQLIGLLVLDFLKYSHISFNPYYALILFVILPSASVICLYAAYRVGRKLLFVFQAAKHLLVGAVATVIDLKIFEFLVWAAESLILFNPMVSKALSFLVSTFIKYLGNKYWAFQKNERGEWSKEATQFFLVTMVGLALDVGFFYYFTKIIGPQFALQPIVWTKLSVIFAAVFAAVWNFIGYKFFVFKR